MFTNTEVLKVPLIFIFTHITEQAYAQTATFMSSEQCSRSRHIATCSGENFHKYPAAEEERGVEKGLGHAGHVSPFENTD